LLTCGNDTVPLEASTGFMYAYSTWAVYIQLHCSVHICGPSRSTWWLVLISRSVIPSFHWIYSRKYVLV